MQDDGCSFEVTVFDAVGPGNLIGKNNLLVMVKYSHFLKLLF